MGYVTQADPLLIPLASSKTQLYMRMYKRYHSRQTMVLNGSYL
jgi:hypothetical protein